MNKLTEQEIAEIYSEIESYHSKFLSGYGVGLPRLRNNSSQYTKDALVLVYLTQGYPHTRKVSKRELTQFVRQYYPAINDVQQARHLGAQKGWYIAAGGRDNRVVELNRGEYQLYSLEEPYPGFRRHRTETIEGWEEIRQRYGNRCATCGSVEGEPHLYWTDTETRLQKAHMNPRKPLATGNIIPQCQKCNRADRDNWVYDETGRVVKVANPSIVKRSDKEVKFGIYKLLYNEYDGQNPNK